MTQNSEKCRDLKKQIEVATTIEQCDEISQQLKALLPKVDQEILRCLTHCSQKKRELQQQEKEKEYQSYLQKMTEAKTYDQYEELLYDWMAFDYKAADQQAEICKQKLKELETKRKKRDIGITIVLIAAVICYVCVKRLML